MSPEPAQQAEHSSETDLAVMEAMDVLATFDCTLHWHGCTAADVIMVHLSLSEISHFQRINEHYRNFFGDLLPPSHSCVVVGKRPGHRVLLDGSGLYMRTTTLRTDQVDDDDPAVQAAHATTTSQLRPTRLAHAVAFALGTRLCVTLQSSQYAL